jgi:CubicO group peptidase (beta-lactamase class C family)
MMRKLLFGILLSYSTLSLAQDVKAIENYVNQMAKRDEYSGVVLIAKNNEILFEKAYGYAQVEHKIINHTYTKFNLASMGKMFTAVAIMQLIESGKLKLEDTVGKILSDYPNKTVRDNITVHQLLTHTSGMGDFFNQKFQEYPKHTIQSLHDYLPFFVNDSLGFKPGESFGYSNAGYIVLGMMVEKISGKNYYDYVKENIFQPIGMNSTGWDLVADNLAGGYEYSYANTSWKKSSLEGTKGSAAGGGYSTCNDLFKFAKALKGNTLLSKQSFELMTTDQFKNDYGYGFSLTTVNREELVGHNGGAPGASGELDIYKNSGYVVITLSNRSSLDGWVEVRSIIRSKLAGSSPQTEEFFNTKAVVETYKTLGYEAAIGKLKALNGKIKDRIIFRYADNYRQQRMYKEAIDLMKIGVEAFPDNWIPITMLADLYLEAENKNEAIEYYQKSLKLYPENERAIEILAQLKKGNVVIGDKQ